MDIKQKVYEYTLNIEQPFLGVTLGVEVTDKMKSLENGGFIYDENIEKLVKVKPIIGEGEIYTTEELLEKFGKV